MESLKNNISGFVVLNSITDFTTSKLVDFLNQRYGTKKTGEHFTVGDIQQYLRRGFLPQKYGDHPIDFIENEEIGIKLVRVYFNRTRTYEARGRGGS